jgi:DNA-binding NarL/FixJ family response regulator
MTMARKDRIVADRLVIVDDHAPFRALARALLQAEGFEIVGEAADAASALATVRQLRPEVVLVDIGLPDADGFALSRWLAAEPDPPAIVLVSSRDERQYRRRLADSPARGFVAKSCLTAAAVAALIR